MKQGREERGPQTSRIANRQREDEMGFEIERFGGRER